MSRARALLIQADVLMKCQKFIPKGHVRKARDLYFQVYVQMYGYVYKRIARHKTIPRHEIEDIRHSIFPYLLAGGKGFFASMREILNSSAEMRVKFGRIEKLLDRYIYKFWSHYARESHSYGIIDDEFIDPQYIIDMTTHLNPETIALMKYERNCLIELLLKAPRTCRIGVRRYEEIAREYLCSLYGVGGFTRQRCNDKKRFAYDYVVYSIRKIVSKYSLNIEDIYGTSLFDAYIEPTFSQLLADRLGINNTILPPLESLFTKKGKPHEREKAFREYQDYERNHQKFLIPD